MNKWNFTAEDWFYGLSKSKIVGKGFPRLDGADLFKDLGYISAGNAADRQDSTNIQETIYQMVIDNSNPDADNASKLWCVGNTKTYKWDLDAENLEVTLDLDDGYTKGALVYGAYLYLATTNDIGRGTLDCTNLTEFAWDKDYMSAVPTGKNNLNDASAPHPMIQIQDTMYVLDGRYVGSFDGTTFNYQALDLEARWKGISTDQWGEWMVIGAVEYPDNQSGYGANRLFGQKRSRLFFWDRIASSWDKDRSTDIDGRLIWVRNKKGVLYVLLEHYPGVFELTYFDGTTLQTIKKINLREWDIVSPSSEPAVTISENLIYFGINGETTGTIKCRIMAFGKYDNETPNSLYVPYAFNPDSTSAVNIYCMEWSGGATPSLYLGIDNGSVDGLYKIKTPWTGIATTDLYTIETPEMFAGKKQACKKIRIITKPLASGDTLYIKRKIDNGSWDSSAWKTFDYTTYSTADEFIITDNFEFRTLQLRLYTGAGDDVRIREIYVESNDSIEP